tara:strand:- start:3062 stop:3580 length:519 start_codon:yes stop_codon:yes gene_type:complete
MFFLSSNVGSQTGIKQYIDTDDKDSIEITSDRMRSESKGDKIVFSGNVRGRWGDLIIVSDILEIYNSQDVSKAQEIVAIGNVTITRGLKKAKGDRAVYLDQAKKIIMTGSPKAFAWEGKNKIEGREMIFLLEKDKFVVKDRVRMKIYPEKKRKILNKKRNPISRSQLKILPK